MNLPVIVISALDEMESVIRCIGLGVEDFCPSPSDPLLLKRAAERMPGEETAARP